MKCSINKQSLQKVKALNYYNKSSESNAKHTRGVVVQYIAVDYTSTEYEFQQITLYQMYLKSHAMKTITP